MTKSPSEIAELLAKHCAGEVWKNDKANIQCSLGEFIEDYRETILQSIPLKELLECKNAASELSIRYSMVRRGTAESIELIGLNNTLRESINNLDTKLREAIGGGE